MGQEGGIWEGPVEVIDGDRISEAAFSQERLAATAMAHGNRDQGAVRALDD